MTGKRLSNVSESAAEIVAKDHQHILNVGQPIVSRIQLQVPLWFLPPVTWTTPQRIVNWTISNIGASDAI